MDKRAVVLYLNNTLRSGYGEITMSDARFMSANIRKKTGKYIAPETIIEAALNSPVEMMEKYRSGLWHSLINDYKIEVLTLSEMNINGIKGEQIIVYR